MRILTLLLALASLLGAQDLREVSLRTLCFKRVGSVKEVMLLTGSKENPEPVAVPLYTGIYSDPIQTMVSGDRLTFALPAAGGSGFKTVGEGKLPPKGTRLQAIFIPSGKPDQPYNVLVLDEGEDNFPLGETILINLAPEPTRITLGEHDKTVAPGKMERLPIATDTNEFNQTTVRIFVPGSEKGKWRPVSSTTWQVLPNLRNLAIAYQNPRNGRTSVDSFQEVPPWRLEQFEEP
ncbi:hypothetical protein [Roseibacillus ishigakijimensis]|uniref:Uncharacterized protein n=1 Tax=Roseibacillus ishigakijimensis TaxID=454146 RepID=A0A934RNB0_9BACT|nr:hypothetical protein [Roseibacillus ishigakijimensis]MBK1834539.1 hypothetical protein [Roseibacillus ishigakijimensis]